MGNLILDVGMSLDGFITGAKGDLARVHDWMFQVGGAAATSAEVITEFFNTTDASMMGKGTWEAVDGPNGSGPVAYWGKEGPELLEHSTLDGHIQEFIYRPNLH